MLSWFTLPCIVKHIHLSTILLYNIVFLFFTCDCGQEEEEEQLKHVVLLFIFKSDKIVLFKKNKTFVQPWSHLPENNKIYI